STIAGDPLTRGARPRPAAVVRKGERMVEDKVEPREVSWRQRLPWTEIFQGFRVALDFNKLVLAAAGILVMAFGWWLLAWIFYYGEPVWSAPAYAAGNYAGADEDQRKDNAWRAFKTDRQK